MIHRAKNACKEHYDFLYAVLYCTYAPVSTSKRHLTPVSYKDGDHCAYHGERDCDQAGLPVTEAQAARGRDNGDHLT